MSHKILILTNEASGDQHAAELAKEIYAKWPDVKISAMGGQKLSEAGVNLIVKPKGHSMIGLGGSFKIWWDIIKSYLKIARTIREEKPDLVILIDAPAFNLRMAKHAKRAGCKVLYYIGPQLWAWKKKRIEIVKKTVDHMAVILPFEKTLYEKAGVKADYVGHPLVSQVKCDYDQQSAKKCFDLKEESFVIGLAPGSRKAELTRIFPVMLQAAELIQSALKNVRFLVPIASSFHTKEFDDYLAKHPALNIQTITQHRYVAMKACDVVLATSGTVTLEIALLQTAMLIVYITSTYTYEVGRRLITLPYIGLCNVVAEKKIVPELIQHDASPEKLSIAAIEILTNNQKKTEMVDEMAKLRSQLTSSDEIVPIIQIVESLLV